MGRTKGLLCFKKCFDNMSPHLQSSTQCIYSINLINCIKIEKHDVIWCCLARKTFVSVGHQRKQSQFLCIYFTVACPLSERCVNYHFQNKQILNDTTCVILFLQSYKNNMRFRKILTISFIKYADYLVGSLTMNCNPTYLYAGYCWLLPVTKEIKLVLINNLLVLGARTCSFKL